MLDILLHILQIEKYTTTDAQGGKNSHIYVQSLFRHSKTTQKTLVYNQLMIAYNNLNWRFRVYISEPKEDITIQDFLDVLDGKTSTWRKKIKHHYSSTGLFTRP